MIWSVLTCCFQVYSYSAPSLEFTTNLPCQSIPKRAMAFRKTLATKSRLFVWVQFWIILRPRKSLNLTYIQTMCVLASFLKHRLYKEKKNEYYSLSDTNSKTSPWRTEREPVNFCTTVAVQIPSDLFIVTDERIQGPHDSKDMRNERTTAPQLQSVIAMSPKICFCLVIKVSIQPQCSDDVQVLHLVS